MAKCVGCSRRASKGHFFCRRCRTSRSVAERVSLLQRSRRHNPRDAAWNPGPRRRRYLRKGAARVLGLTGGDRRRAAAELRSLRRRYGSRSTVASLISLGRTPTPRKMLGLNPRGYVRFAERAARRAEKRRRELSALGRYRPAPASLESVLRRRKRKRRSNPAVTSVMRAAMKKAWRQIKASRRRR